MPLSISPNISTVDLPIKLTNNKIRRMWILRKEKFNSIPLIKKIKENLYQFSPTICNVTGIDAWLQASAA